MAVSLEQMKNYLRVDFSDDDDLITGLISSSKKRCMDIVRIDDEETFDVLKNADIAVMYTTAFFYEHREEADCRDLNLTLRALLFGDRKEGF